MLAAGTASQASFSAIGVGLPALAPAIRSQFGLTLSQVGVVLAASWVGTLLTLLGWGFAADRFGERAVLAVGLTSCSAALAAAAYAPGFTALILLLGLAGAVGASVNSASGRAVMQWFPVRQRGLALGIRQTAIPIGGLVGALALPHLGVTHGLLFLAGFCLVTAVVGGVFVREPHEQVVAPEAVEWTLRDHRLWALCAASGLLLVAQVAITGFVVLFLHDTHGVSAAAAAGVLAGIQVVAGALRIGVGRWSDVLGTRAAPLRRLGVTTAVALAVTAALTGMSLWILVPAFVLAGGLSMAWNGLSFTAAAELAGRARSGAAIGFQQSVLAGVGAGAPVAFAALVGAAGWRTAFGLAALGPLASAGVLRRLPI